MTAHRISLSQIAEQRGTTRRHYERATRTVESTLSTPSVLDRQWLKHSVNVVDAFIETAHEKGWMDEIAN